MNYPIGIQTFANIRETDFAYVDKTAFVYKLASQGKCYFLSRPRRFGKSLLLSTLKSYFQGNREMFEGLAISKLEKEWKKYPVLHLDLNVKKYENKESLIALLDRHLEQWETEHGDRHSMGSVEDRFYHCIVNAADEALQQIEDKQYAAPFKADPRKLFKIGVCFSSEERGISEWKVKD